MVMNQDNSLSYDELFEKTATAGQEHVFKWWNELGLSSRKKLLEQISNIDFDELVELIDKFVTNAGESGSRPKIEPAEVIPLPSTPEQTEQAVLARETGEAAIRDGRVSVVVVAGGQSTRLGYPGPKGTFRIGPLSDKSLFQFHGEKIRAMRHRYKACIPWYIMTSKTNHAETVSFFEENRFFGLEDASVRFFTQEMIQAVDMSGRLILDEKDHIFENPNGHGGTITSLARAGMLRDMRDKGVDLVFYCQVDNILNVMADPVFLGHHILAEAEMSAKIVPKRDPYEKVGIIGRLDGSLGVIEYSDMNEDDMVAVNPDGSLKYDAGSIAIHAFNIDFLEGLSESGSRLPYHSAKKAIPFIDDTGKRVCPETPNGIKFESFIFDALSRADSVAIIEVSRTDEFGPVKNRSGEDSPETARRLLVNLHGRWLEEAGVPVPRDADGNVEGLVEIGPLFALDAGELKMKIDPGLLFDGKLLLD